MGVLKIVIILFAFQLISCSKMVYIIEQGNGQFSLLQNGRWNEDVLNDKNIKEKFKDKIRKIEKYKSFFYTFFGKPEGKIYSKTTFLETKAVSHMVIVSPYNKIKAMKECFFIVGCFPYLAFFSKESALEYKKKKEDEGFETSIRPVYAYSTLDYFTDTILSSFFIYNDESLVELIFHELFHTVFFVKNEVSISESLAQYFGRELSYIYSNLDDKEINIRKLKKQKNADLRKKIVDLVRKLNALYKDKRVLNKKDSLVVLDKFLEEQFVPAIEKKCVELKIDKKQCYPLKKKWNNASFAAYMTYEQNIEKLQILRRKLKMNLKEFFYYLETGYNDYKSSDKEISFKKFLFKN